MSVAVIWTVPSKNRTGSMEYMSVEPPPSALALFWIGLLQEQFLSLESWSWFGFWGLPGPPEALAAALPESKAVADGRRGPDSGGSGLPSAVTLVWGSARLLPS